MKNLEIYLISQKMSFIGVFGLFGEIIFLKVQSPTTFIM